MFSVDTSPLQQALEHPYVAQFHNPPDEPAAPFPIKIPIDCDHKYSIGEYRDMLYADIVKKKKLQRQKYKKDKEKKSSK